MVDNHELPEPIGLTNPISTEQNILEASQSVPSPPHDEKISLKGIRMKNLRGLIIAYLNINSLRNKFESLKFLIGTNVDVLVIAETKVNGTLQTHLHTRGAKIGLATPGKP